MVRDSISYSHGDAGTQPPDGNEFAANERPDAQHFDWKWSRTIESINNAWDEFDRIDADDDGVVDRADELASASVGDGISGGDATALSLDESYSPTWTSQHQFDAGLDTRGDVVDGATTIWDSVGGHVEQSALENDTITVAGHAIALGESQTLSLSDLDSVTATGEGDGGNFNADAIDGYDVEKDGTDGTGVINFKTT